MSKLYKMYVAVGGSEPKEYLITEEDKDIIVNKPREDWFMFTIRALDISLPRRSIMLIEPFNETTAEAPTTPNWRRGKRLHEVAAKE